MTNMYADSDGFTSPSVRNDSWMALFGLGIAAGIGIVVASTTLKHNASLTGYLNSDRVAEASITLPRVSMAMVPNDLVQAPHPTEDRTNLALAGYSLSDADIRIREVPQSVIDLLDQPAPVLEEDLPAPSFTVASLEQQFSDLNYDLSAIRRQATGVPRVFADAVPHDLDEIVDVVRRKALFFKMVLPLVLRANDQIRADRARIQDLQARTHAHEAISQQDQVWLDQQFERYRVSEGNWTTLLRKVDVIPPSLALAQAAIESGWGTSRFAREGNALFGQWVWGDTADGIVPEDREEGATHRIRAFDTPYDAVVAYIKNLNTHRAYRDLRELRATMRQDGAAMNGMTLAQGLESYSEKGHEYISLLRNIISSNQLRPFDRAHFRDSQA